MPIAILMQLALRTALLADAGGLLFSQTDTLPYTLILGLRCKAEDIPCFMTHSKVGLDQIEAQGAEFLVVSQFENPGR